MTQAEVQETITDSGCLLFCAGEKELLAMMVYLLWIAQNPGGEMTIAEVQELQTDSTCIRGCMSHKDLLAAIVQLLFAGGGTGAGGFTFTTAAGEPPIDGSITTQGYVDSDSDIKYINIAWPDTASPNWRQF